MHIKQPRKPAKFINYEVCWHGANDNEYEHVDTQWTKGEAVKQAQGIVKERGGYVHVLKTYCDYYWQPEQRTWESEVVEQICVTVVRKVRDLVLKFQCYKKRSEEKEEDI